MEDFKDRLILLRKERDYSQETLAKMLDVAKSSVAMWETGKRKPQRETIEQIADIFNVDMDYIFGKSDIRRKVTFDEVGNEYIYSDESAHLVAKLRSNVDLLHTVQDMCELPPEHLKMIADMVNALKKN